MNNLFHITGLAVEMDNNDSPGKGGNFIFNRLRTDIKSPGINIRKDRTGIAEQAAVSGGNVSEWSGYDLVPCLYSSGPERDMQSSRTAVNCHGIPDANISSEGFFKCGNLLALGELAGLQDLQHCLPGFLIDMHFSHVDHFRNPAVFLYSVTMGRLNTAGIKRLSLSIFHINTGRQTD
jgi:hypothetical protein